MKFIVSYWLACLLACCLLLRLLLKYFLLFDSAGRNAEGHSEINPFTKNASSIAQNCSETQSTFSFAENVLLIDQKCRETQISFAVQEPFQKKIQNCSKTSHLSLREAGRFPINKFIHFCALRCGERFSGQSALLTEQNSSHNVHIMFEAQQFVNLVRKQQCLQVHCVSEVAGCF